MFKRRQTKEMILIWLNCILLGSELRLAIVMLCNLMKVIVKVIRQTKST